MPESTEQPTKPPRSWWKMLLRVAVGCLVTAVALVALGTAIMPTVWIVFKQNPGTFDRQRFESVVAKVRSMNLARGSEVALRMDDVSDLESIRLMKPDESIDRGRGTGCIWAEVSTDNKLKVVIETRDLGHAGEYGFAYSDVPLVPRASDAGWFELEVPSHLTWVKPNMKIDGHWWRVHYNLD